MSVYLFINSAILVSDVIFLISVKKNKKKHEIVHNQEWVRCG